MKRVFYLLILAILPGGIFGQNTNHGLGCVLTTANFNTMVKLALPPVPRRAPGTSRDQGPPATYVVNAPPPGDQGTDGTCVGWAVGYCFFSAYLQRHQPNIVWNESTEMSPGFLYHFIKLNNDCANAGSNVPLAMESIRNIGDCSWSAWPYALGDCNRMPTYAQELEGDKVRSPLGDPNATNDQAVKDDGRTVNVNGVIQLYGAINPTNISDFKAFLMRYNWPFVVAFNVNTSFDDMWNLNGIWISNYGTVRGGHSVCVVGWDDNKEYNGKKGMFKCQNQWGNGGDNGYFWVTYEMVSAGCFQEAYGWVRDEPGH